MSEIYTSGDFTSVRATDYWIEYPFEEYGENAAKIYYFVCSVNQDAYSPLTQGTNNLTDAASAGLISTPVTDAGARWISDSSFRSIGGGKVEFTRKFATVPATHSRYDGIVVDLPFVRADTSNDIIFLGGPTEMPAEFEYTFSTTISSLTRSKKFTIIAADGVTAVNYVSDSPNATTPTKSAFYSSTERVAEPTDVQRYMGDIYMAITPKIVPGNAYTP